MKGDREVRRRIWDREGNRGMELMHRCVGIVGHGNMGAAFARRLSGFGCRVLAYDKYKTGFGTEDAEESSLERLFDQADVLSLHVPLTDETRGFYNSAFFGQFRHNLIVINTARGEILPLEDLLREMKSGKVLAAGLDVLEKENFTRLSAREDAVLAEMMQLENVLFTPHVAGWTAESYVKINQALADKIAALGLV
jgi:D-3-phosphoglycerate dehydrogenase / 2-oxoglutarate reductase